MVDFGTLGHLASSHGDVQVRLRRLITVIESLSPCTPVAGAAPPGKPLADTAKSVSIPLDIDRNWSYVHVSVWGQAEKTWVATRMVFDTGSTCMIYPNADDLSPAVYERIGDPVTEPWGCPAVVVQGPVKIGQFELGASIKFLACTGENENKQRTSVFGAGPGIGTMMDVCEHCPLEQISGTYRFSEIKVHAGTLVLHKNKPPEYAQMLPLMHNDLPTLPIIGLSIPGAAAWAAENWFEHARNNYSDDIGLLLDTAGGPTIWFDPAKILANSGAFESGVIDTWCSGSSAQGGCGGIGVQLPEVTLTLGSAGASVSIDLVMPVSQGTEDGIACFCTNDQFVSEMTPLNVGGALFLSHTLLIDWAGRSVGILPNPSRADGIF